MLKSITLMVAPITLACFSIATWAEPLASTATLKAQCRQSMCTTKCDAKGEKCLITCDDKKTGNNCGKSSFRTPGGVLEVRGAARVVISTLCPPRTLADDRR